MRFVLVSVLIAWTCACVSGQDLADVTQTVGEGLGSLIGGEGFEEFSEEFQDALAKLGGGNNNGTQLSFGDYDDGYDDISPELIRQILPNLPEECDNYLIMGQECEEAKEGATSCPTICQEFYRGFSKECQDYFIEMSETFAGLFGDLLDTFDFGEDLDDDGEEDVCAEFLRSLGDNINSPPGGKSAAPVPFPKPTTFLVLVVFSVSIMLIA